MDDPIHRLLSEMKGLESALRANGEQLWADRVQDAGRLVAERDAEGLSRLLGLYGTMGAINDRFEPVDTVDRLGRVYRLAHDLWRQHERDNSDAARLEG